ncbi:MAG: nucleotide exchange factor GrpE [Microgenomates group bacterium]
MKKKELEELKKKVEELNKQLEEVKKTAEDYKNKYLRALADYQNLDKRVSEEKLKWPSKIKGEIFLKLLPILDNLEKAEIFIKDDGLKLIKDNFYQLLKNEGVEELDILGKEFNPQLAEAVEVVKGEKDNIIVEILRKGYLFGDKVLRAAQVKVSKKNPDQEAVKKAKEELVKGDYM